MMYGAFHPVCWALMWSLDEGEVSGALPDTLESLAVELEACAAALRAVPDNANVVVRLTQACEVLSHHRGHTGQHLLNLHQYRTLLFTRRTLMN